ADCGSAGFLAVGKQPVPDERATLLSKKDPQPGRHPAPHPHDGSIPRSPPPPFRRLPGTSIPDRCPISLPADGGGYWPPPLQERLSRDAWTAFRRSSRPPFAPLCPLDLLSCSGQRRAFLPVGSVL